MHVLYFKGAMYQNAYAVVLFYQGGGNFFFQNPRVQTMIKGSSFSKGADELQNYKLVLQFPKRLVYQIILPYHVLILNYLSRQESSQTYDTVIRVKEYA